MAHTPEVLIPIIKNHLAAFQVKLNTRKNDNDYYILAENLLIKVLNLLFDISLYNPNKENNTFAGVDLIDKNNRICFQVTYQNSLDKVKDAVFKTISNYPDDYDSLYVLCLSPKQQSYSQKSIDEIIEGNSLKFSVNKHIIDITDLSKRVNYLAKDPEKLEELEQHLAYILKGSEKILFEGNSEMQESENALYTFIEKTYINSQYIRMNLDLSLIRKYSQLFSFILSVEGYLEIEKLHGSELFDALIKYIRSSESENPLVVTGTPGSGKSTFLALLYKYFCTKMELTREKPRPLYINLQNYLNSTSEETAADRLKEDLLVIKNLVEPQTSLILILDGCDDSFRYSIEIAKSLIDITLTELNVKKKIVGVNISDKNFYNSRQDNTAYNFKAISDSKITLTDLSIYDKAYPAFVNLYSTIRLHKKTDQDISIQEFTNSLKEQIKKYKINRIDLFTLYIQSETQKRIAYRNCKTLSEFYKTLCIERLSNAKDSTLLGTSEMAFDFYIRKRGSENFNRLGWELINTHLTIRDYLLAFQIINKLTNIGKAIDTNRLNKKEYEIFNFVYTDHINNFCKEIMNSENAIQKYVYDAIIRIFPKVPLTAQTHFCYLLGRFNTPDKIAAASNFLKLKLAETKTAKDKSNDRQYLLYVRTIYISLIYLGQPFSNEYIDKLLSDKSWDSLNRGFHREYYGDIPFDPGVQSLTLEDNISSSFSNTFTKLYRKINDAINSNTPYPLFAIEMYTLCSLAHHRQSDKNGNLDLEQLSVINELIKLVLKKQMLSKYKALTKYANFLTLVFDKGTYIPAGAFLNQVYNIKNENRQGWVERKVPFPEKVSSHIYGAYIIGKICLPDIIDGDHIYNKNTILEMILVHDIGEAIVGDKTPATKTLEHKTNEKRAVEAIGFLGTYFGNDLRSITSNFRDFETKNEENININITIANELDKLDNLMQLYIYGKNHRDTIADYDIWKDRLTASITSDPGRRIMELIIEYFESYDRVINGAILGALRTQVNKTS